MPLWVCVVVAGFFHFGAVAGFAWYRGWVCLVMVVAEQGLLCDDGS